jgi:hypothetical protein
MRARRNYQGGFVPVCLIISKTGRLAEKSVLGRKGQFRFVFCFYNFSSKKYLLW